jgi:hypothetical protein
MNLTAKSHSTGRRLVPKKKKLIAKGKSRNLLAHPRKGKSRRGGPRERSGRFSLFRPKVRGRAYPVQDNEEGWKLFDRLAKQSGLSGSDIFTLGMRYLARENPQLSKESALKISKNLAEHKFFAKAH